MAGTKIKIPPKKKARVEIIPLIDVIFFLLATFVLFTLSLNRIQSVPVDLPVPSQTKEPPDPKLVQLQVSGDGALYWNREPIDMSELPARLTNLRATEADPKIMLSGDERAKFGATVVVLDEIRKANIEKFSVETTPRATGK